MKHTDIVIKAAVCVFFFIVIIALKKFGYF